MDDRWRILVFLLPVMVGGCTRSDATEIPLSGTQILAVGSHGVADEGKQLPDRPEPSLVLPSNVTSTTAKPLILPPPTTTESGNTFVGVNPTTTTTTTLPAVTTTSYVALRLDVPVERAPTTRRVEVETVQEMVLRIFPEEDHRWALRVMACESSNDPLAVNSWSKTMGLFQHHPRYWDDRSALAGIPGADPFDAESNITVAEGLLNTGSRDHPRGSWHWECK